ncbi:hypothetical protein PSU4_28040 [Pseudonocardia sulfidoxydans NBRC 16205]|uniref:Uncharacterized protein n=2 Tax=Pseudonocardia sulfidoxydans TaxID=54011 RepID=A0A511DGD5_9PSEU|nr:hypothetical protein [Pseudonocardia sulfidoxydans]GEL23850.1 hypothetical protein PSU4_28040 [Pseudonocardia sulfidoxydans NBRC 16205]
MTENRMTAGAVVVSMIFGIVVAILAVTGSEALSLVAIIGGAVVGLTWVVVGMTSASRRRGTQTRS